MADCCVPFCTIYLHSFGKLALVNLLSGQIVESQAAAVWRIEDYSIFNTIGKDEVLSEKMCSPGSPYKNDILFLDNYLSMVESHVEDWITVSKRSEQETYCRSR
jgi:hypothetical protein